MAVTIHRRIKKLDPLDSAPREVLELQHLRRFMEDVSKHVTVTVSGPDDGPVMESELLVIPRKDYDDILDLLRALRGTTHEFYAFQVYRILTGCPQS